MAKNVTQQLIESHWVEGRMTPGEEWWVEIKIRVPWSSKCTLTNRVTVDPFNRIAESNETNNTAYHTTLFDAISVC